MVVNASEVIPVEQVQQAVVQDQLSASENKLVEEHIHFDSKTDKFVLDNEIRSILDSYKVNVAQRMIDETNSQIEQAKFDSNVNVYVEDTQGNTHEIDVSYNYAWGKNDIKFYWNYARIWIDAGNVRLGLQYGFSIGGVVVPSKIIKIGCAAAGIYIGNNINKINHGIWMDYNYYAGRYIKGGMQ